MGLNFMRDTAVIAGMRTAFTVVLREGKNYKSLSGDEIPERDVTRDCNPGIDFSIPGFEISKIPIPGSRRDWRNIVWAYTTIAYGH